MMKVTCPECGTKNNINPQKGSKDKLCMKCRAVISKKGKRPNPKWEEEKMKQMEERAMRRPPRVQPIPVEIMAQMMRSRRGPIVIKSENTPDEVKIEE